MLLLSSLANSNLTCNASECLSWIIVLFNILTVFYLAFCAWFKITKAVKLIGWVWSAINVCATVLIVFLHTCIFTLISAVFTGLITMAVLSIVFANKIKDADDVQTESDDKANGYYVIFNTTDDKFVFRLYDKTKKYYMSSCYKYNYLDDVKRAISLCRKSGVGVMLEDRTNDWVKSLNVPKFVMSEFEHNMQYYNEYVISENLTILKSAVFNDVVACSKCAQKMINAVLTNELFIAKEILDGNDFKDEVKNIETTQNPVIQETVAVTDKPVEQVVETVAEMTAEKPKDGKEEPNDISFNLNVKYTFNEELAMQDKTIQDLYYGIRDYALSKANVKEFDSQYKIKFKWGRNDLMHVIFKNGELECGVMTGSSELKKMILQNIDKSIKERPTKIRLISIEAYDTIKNLIDIAYANIEEARNTIKN